MCFTWPLDLVGVSQVHWGRDKHLSVGDGWPKRHHVESAVVADWGVLFRVDDFACRLWDRRAISICKKLAVT